MRLRQFQVDAFTEHPFQGNPAAVCLLDGWLDDSLLQAIAAENNLSETAFVVPVGDRFELRWFTPLCEVVLCGHATLATAHVLFKDLHYRQPVITFETKSGPLLVESRGNWLRMDFPARPAKGCQPPEALIAGLGVNVTEVLAADDYMVILDDEDDVRAINPDFTVLGTLDLRGVMVTAPGRNVDFVSRFFGPRVGVPEDPVTGSAHCTMAPYWAYRQGKTTLSAKQISRRGGELICEVNGQRVFISGKAVTVMEAELMPGDIHAWIG